MLLNYNIGLHLIRAHPEYEDGDLGDAVELFKALIVEHQDELMEMRATAGTALIFAKAANDLACCLLAMPWGRYVKAETLALRWMKKHQGKKLLWSSDDVEGRAAA
jgi:hypothetical protein